MGASESVLSASSPLIRQRNLLHRVIHQSNALDYMEFEQDQHQTNPIGNWLILIWKCQYNKLFSTYRDRQGEEAPMICKKQEEIEDKIKVADVLAIKLLNYSVPTMKTTSCTSYIASGAWGD
ncbi:hypothetical protein V6N13_052492 [Hibiscus sabdariffa]